MSATDIPAIASFTIDDRGARPFRTRPAGAGRNRVLLASPDHRFLDHAMAKLRGTSFHTGVVMRAEGVVPEIDRLRPHVVIIAERLLDEARTLPQVLPRRYPGLPILVVASERPSSGRNDWEVVNWGGVGRVAEEDLLRGRTLPDVISELARMGSGGGSATS